MPHKSLLITLSTALLVLTMGSAFAAPKRSGRLFVAEPQVFGVVGRSTVDALTRSIVQQARQTRFRVVVEAQLRAQQRRFRGQFRQCRKTTGQCSVWAARLARATLMVRSEIIRLSESLYQVRFAFMDPTWRIDALRTDFVVFGGEAEVLRQARIGIVNLFEGKQGVDLLDRYQQSYGLYARVRVGDLKLAYGLWRALLGEEGIEKLAPEHRVLDLKDPYRSMGRLLVHLRVPGWIEVQGRRISDFRHPVILGIGTYTIKVHSFTGKVRRTIRLRVTPRRTRSLEL